MAGPGHSCSWSVPTWIVAHWLLASGGRGVAPGIAPTVTRDPAPVHSCHRRRPRLVQLRHDDCDGP
jgi:hypothetical protein